MPIFAKKLEDTFVFESCQKPERMKTQRIAVFPSKFKYETKIKKKLCVKSKVEVSK